MHYILILFMATSFDSRSGAGGIAIEFNNKQACEVAGAKLAKEAYRRGNYVLTWSCNEKGKD